MAASSAYDWPSTSRSHSRLRCSIGQLPEKIGHDGRRLSAPGKRILDLQRVGRFLAPPPIRGLLASDAVEPCAQCSAVKVEPLGAAPNVGVGVLHDILGRLQIAEQVTKEAAQPRSGLAIPAVKGLGVACRNLLPEFPFVEQLRSPICTSGGGRKRFRGGEEILSEKRKAHRPEWVMRLSSPLKQAARSRKLRFVRRTEPERTRCARSTFR